MSYDEYDGRRTVSLPMIVAGLAVLAALGISLFAVDASTPGISMQPQNINWHAPERQFAVFFDVLVCGDTVPRKKPDPMPLLFACERLAVAPQNALFIGDSLNDVVAARAAGCPVWCVPYGYNEGRPAATLDCDRLVADLDEAAQRIAALSS